MLQFFFVLLQLEKLNTEYHACMIKIQKDYTFTKKECISRGFLYYYNWKRLNIEYHGCMIYCTCTDHHPKHKHDHIIQLFEKKSFHNSFISFI